MADTLIQLFARPPVEGRVKTRLIPALGSEKALAVYRHCLQYNLSLVGNSGFDHQLWLSESDHSGEFDNQRVHLQQGADLGARMLHAMHSGLDDYRRVILIGSDCLDLSVGLLHQVDARLSQAELVLVPAEDGGYVLIAARKSIHPRLFEGIPWGTPRVLEQTKARIDELECNAFLFNSLRDIDRVEDLQHYPGLRKYL